MAYQWGTVKKGGGCTSPAGVGLGGSDWLGPGAWGWGLVAQRAPLKGQWLVKQ